MKQSSLNLYTSQLRLSSAQAQLELVRAQEEVARLEQALARQQREHELAAQAAQQQATQGVAITLWRLHAQTLTGFEQQHKQTQQQLERARVTLLHAEQQRQEAHREEQRMERVNERLLSQRRIASDRKEAREMDELGAAKLAIKKQALRR